MPKTRRARAADHRPHRAGRANVGQRVADRRAEGAGRRLQVVVQQALGEQRSRARRAGDGAAQAVELVAVAAEPEAVVLRVDLRRAQAVGGRDDEQPDAGRVAERADALADAGHQAALGRELARDVGAAPARYRGSPASPAVVARGGGRQPQRGGGVGAPAAHAGGDGDALGDRDADGRAVPAGRRAEARERAGGEVLALDAGADHLVRVAVRGLQLELVGHGHRLNEGHQRVVAVRARPADEQAQVDLARREAAQPRHAASCSWRARHSPGASCSARASGGRPMAWSAARARSRMPGWAPGASESERASALRRCAKPWDTSARSAGAGAGPRRVRPTRTESTFGTGWNTVRDTGRRTFTSAASWASTLGTP